MHRSNLLTKVVFEAPDREEDEIRKTERQSGLGGQPVHKGAK